MEELILKNQEFKEKLAELINKSELPAFIIKNVLVEILAQVGKQEELQLNQAQTFIKKGKEENHE